MNLIFLILNEQDPLNTYFCMKRFCFELRKDEYQSIFYSNINGVKDTTGCNNRVY